MGDENNKYKRIPNTSFFGIYIGVDESNRRSIFVKLKKKPVISVNNKYMLIECNKRKDGLWALTISILDQRYNGVFQKFIDDLVNCVAQEENPLLAERKFISRFIEWKTLFDKDVNTLLSFSEIVGLAGELYFLKHFMFLKYGVEKSLYAWSGPTGANKDFIIDETWYEIKTKSLNKNTVHLTNQNQLESDKVGYLSIVNYEKSSDADNNSTNLFDLYVEISNWIDDSYLQSIFIDKLSTLNFIPNERYRELNFCFYDIDFYKVDLDFPKISNETFKEIILNIEYDIFLPSLSKYTIEV